MQRLRYDAPSHYTLREDGKEIAGGSEFEVSDERALELLTDPNLNVSEVDNVDQGAETPSAEETDAQATDATVTSGSPRVGWITRAKLNKRAADAGVENPELLPNRAAVEAAIAEATQPEAEDGEGPTTTYDEED